MNLSKLVRNVSIACVFSFLGVTTAFAAEQARLDARLSAAIPGIEFKKKGEAESDTIRDLLYEKMDWNDLPKVAATTALIEEQAKLQSAFLSQYDQVKTQEARKAAYDTLISSYAELKARAKQL